jgi:DNA polymerase-3 subunit delta'
VTTFDEIVGQEAALTTLRQALVNPVHAYLFIGGEGAGKELAAKAFAAALVCAEGGCGNCRNCTLAAAGQHPDIVETSRSGAMVSVDDLRALAAISQRKPLEAARQVLIVEDVHLATKSAPALLKTLEEPPPSTIFVLLADDLPPELVTIASRCVEVGFPPLSTKTIAASLAANGCDPETARTIARASSGNLERAELLAKDPAFAGRVAMWTAIASQLGGGGAEIAQLVADLLAATEASVQPMKERNAADLAEREAQSQALGERALPGRKDLTDRYARIERRYRSDELRAGLGQLQRTYADLLADAVSAGGDQADTARRCGASIDAITEFFTTVRHNPNETLALQALFLKLTALRP